MRVVVVTPPPLKPSEPGLSGAAAASRLAALGAEARWIDASIGWQRFALDPARLRGNLAAARDVPEGERRAMARAADSMGMSPPALRRPETYEDRALYTSSVNDLENALRASALPFPGFRLGLAMVALENPTRRLESSATLRWLAGTPGPFDAYFLDSLLPALAADGAPRVAISLTFQQQAPAAFRLARLLRERLPGLSVWLGGPLVASWAVAGFPLAGELFADFDRVSVGSDEDLRALAEAPGDAPPPGMLAPPLDQTPWDDYLSPRPVVPAALGMGCYFRRCTFCADRLHRPHAPTAEGDFDRFLAAVAERFPGGAMLHLTDSALPPDHLEHLAEVIRSQRLPLSWHGFVRAEERFADPAFARRLAEGGCSMLQIGVESGSPEMLRRMGKGIHPETARRVLAATAQAGIKNHVYLLFGVPGERDADREMTLDLVRAEAAHIHAINPSLLNLPVGSPMYRRAAAFGITELVPFAPDTDYSLAVDFRCGTSHPRREARAWLAHRFFKDPEVRRIQGHLKASFKANHLCFLGSEGGASRARERARNPGRGRADDVTSVA
jgi:hypothetical protein